MSGLSVYVTVVVSRVISRPQRIKWGVRVSHAFLNQNVPGLATRCLKPLPLGLPFLFDRSCIFGCAASSRCCNATVQQQHVAATHYGCGSTGAPDLPSKSWTSDDHGLSLAPLAGHLPPPPIGFPPHSASTGSLKWCRHYKAAHHVTRRSRIQTARARSSSALSGRFALRRRPGRRRGCSWCGRCRHPRLQAHPPSRVWSQRLLEGPGLASRSAGSPSMPHRPGQGRQWRRRPRWWRCGRASKGWRFGRARPPSWRPRRSSRT